MAESANQFNTYNTCRPIIDYFVVEDVTGPWVVNPAHRNSATHQFRNRIGSGVNQAAESARAEGRFRAFVS